jgi:hypothetical protein
MPCASWRAWKTYSHFYAPPRLIGFCGILAGDRLAWPVKADCPTSFCPTARFVFTSQALFICCGHAPRRIRRWLVQTDALPPANLPHPDDQRLTGLARACRTWPELAGIRPGCLHRWCRRGVRGHTLPSQFVGGRRFVRRCDVRLFLAKLNLQQGYAVPTEAAPTQRKQWVQAQLAAAGI